MSTFFGQFVIGPAGSGKSTYCKMIQDMGMDLRRNILVINLDPAAESFKYRCNIDVRDLINIDDVMDFTKLGPNGGLIYAMEYLIENTDWLEDQCSDLCQDDYVLFDCPGQQELYTHLDLMKKVVVNLKNIGFSQCSVCLVDSTFLIDESKFFSGILMALSTMISLELPHVTVQSKCDLVDDKDLLKKYLKLNYAKKIVDTDDLGHINAQQKANGNVDEIDWEKLNNPDNKPGLIEKTWVSSKFTLKYKKLSEKIKDIVNDYNMVSLLPLDVTDPETIESIIYHTDTNIGYLENKEAEERHYFEAEERLGMGDM